MAPEKGRGSSQRVANSLLALSSAAVLAVYAAGYLRTRPAAERFAVEAAARQPQSSQAPTSIVPAPSRPTVSSRPAPATLVPNAPPPSAPSESSTAPSAETPTAVEFNDPAAPNADVTAEPAVAPSAVQAVQDEQYKDGTYLGWGSCRHGDIQASVVVEGGRIAAASIAQCLTRYSCSWIEALPGQVVSRQSTNVDYVSGATQSTDAFAEAVTDALSKAK